MSLVDDITETIGEVRDTIGPEPVTKGELYGDKEVDRDPLKILPIGVAGTTVRGGTTAATRILPSLSDDALKAGAAATGAVGTTLGINALTNDAAPENDKSVAQEMAEEMGTATYSEGGGGDPDDFTDNRSGEDTRPWYTQLRVKLAGLFSSLGLSGLAGWILGKTDGNGGPLDQLSDALKALVASIAVLVVVYVFGQLLNVNIGDSGS